MRKVRIISRIDVKNEFAIKGIHLEGLRKVGNPNDLAKKYFEEGIDEIIFMDAVASYYDRNSLSEIISNATKDVFVPITVGGGIRNINDIQIALNSGADKVAINTQAVKNPLFIKEASEVFGSQCIVASIEAKRTNQSSWEAYYDNGRESSQKDVVEWAKELEQLGAGELMITSVDNEGTKKGFDYSLIKEIFNTINIPVICCGGAGKLEHFNKIFESTDVDAIAAASVFHYSMLEIKNIKTSLANHGVAVRK